MSLVTRCPRCESEFEVTSDQLKLHDGLVRCGQCSHVFDGFANLKDNLPTLTRKVSAPVATSTNPPASPAISPAISAAVTLTDMATPAAGETALTQTVADGVDHMPSTRDTVVAQPAQPSPASLPDDLPSQPMAPVWPTAAPVSGTVSTPQTVESEPLESNAAAQPPQEGRFVPRVDAQLAATSRSTDGRFEPGWQAASVATPTHPDLEQRSTSPGFLASAATNEPKEPTLGASIFKRQSEPPTDEPSIKIIGEARLRGDDPSAYGRTVPDFLEPEEPEPVGRSVLWALGSILLLLLLAYQALIVFRNDIASTAPNMRPLLEQLCAVQGCQVGYVRDIERIFIVGSALQQAPETDTKDGQRDYVLRLTLQNRASHAQPWPALQLSLNDASSTVVVRKVLMPQDYLPADAQNKPFASRQEISLDVPLRVKGFAISGYELMKFFP